MNILAFFTSNGVPITGLTPTIRIRDVADNSLVVTDAVMPEVGDGNYKYDYTACDLHKDYAIRCDGGVVLPINERYTFGGNENYIEDIETTTLAISAGVKENSDDLKRILGLVHENIFIDNPSYDGDGNMTSARLRIYSNPASVGTGSDVIGTYQITAPSTAPGEFTSWRQVRTS